MASRTIVELDELRERLREAEETLSAIRNGEVDSLVVAGPEGDRVFSLRGAEQPYRVFVEKMLEGAVTLNTSGVILYCNHRFAEMMKSPLERMIGAELQTYFQEADRGQLQEILSSKENRKARLQLATADGTLMPVQLAFSRMPIDEIESFCVVVTDMTEHEEKQELTTALEKLRTAQELLKEQNSELTRARASAEAASEAKDNFLASLSHELRTPLTPVLMAVAALEKNASLPKDVHATLAVIRRNANLEARLIDDLLDLTSIIHGKIALRSERIDLHVCLNEALEICQQSIDAKELRIIRQFEATQVHVSGDDVRIQQILWNLVRNAVKFTASGGQITIRTANQGDRITVSVTDTGIGIDPQMIDKIFKPFEQTDGRITREFGGLGLGLAISQRLAQAQGGLVTAQSEGKGRGATFTLSLPAVTSSEPACQDPAAREDAVQPSTPLRILLVEDHADTRELLAIWLGTKHIVEQAGDIGTAIATATRGERFDLLISDLGLPDGSGFDLLTRLREHYPIKGICLSGYGMERDISHAIAAGFQHHLLKPVDFEMLDSVVQQIAS